MKFQGPDGALRRTNVNRIAHDIPADIAAVQTAEVRRRIAQVESGEVSLIPGDEAFAHVRRIVASALAAN